MSPTDSLKKSACSDEQALGRIIELVSARLHAGEAIDLSDVARAHPEHAEELRQLWPALAAMAELERSQTQAAATAEGGAAEELGQLGDFRLLREIGKGGMGVVYEAEQVSLRRRVALKVLPFAGMLDQRQLLRFQNEARAAACLHHAHIVPVYFVGCERGVHFYAMQLVHGSNLADLIRDLRQQDGHEPKAQTPAASGNEEGNATTAYASPMTPASPAAETAPVAILSTVGPSRRREFYRTVARLGIEAAEALDHAHQTGVVHRDVKPANLLLDGSGHLWVTDFGLAQFTSDVHLTVSGDLVGTVRYMSPEQALAQRVVIDHRTDVYSLGATLYELLTLRPAFGGNNREELLRQIAFEEPVAPRRLARQVPVELETVVLKAMAKNPAERYATARALADDLGRFLRDEPIQARRPSLTQRARKWARRHRAGVTAAGVCLLGILLSVVGSVGWVLGDRSARQGEAEAKVQGALAEAKRGLQEGNPRDPALVSALRRAEAHLDSGLLNQDLHRQVEQLQKDVQMLTDLERVRLDQANVSESYFDRTRSDFQYAQAFRTYGIDMVALKQEEAASRVQASAIREHLVAGLDDWAAGLTDVSKEGTTQKARRLLGVAQQANPDLWRNRLREALLSRAAAQLEQLLRSVPVEELPAGTLGLLGSFLEGDKLPVGLRGKILQSGIKALRRAQRRFPADFWINHNLAQALTQLQPPRLEEAIGFYRAAVALRPQSPGAHLNLGNALRNKGDLDGAIAAARETIRLKEEYPEAHSNLGAALYDKRDLDGAITAFRKAVHLKKDFALGHYGLGKALNAKGKLDEAIAAYREAIQAKNNYPEAYTNLGLALLANKDRDGAIDAFRKALRFKKDFPEAHIAHSNLGLALCHKEDLDGCIDHLREAIRCKPDWAEVHMVHYSLGVALHRKGNVDGAIAAWREAIRLKKDYADARNNLGAALKHKGLLDEAITEFRQIIQFKKDHAEAHSNLGGALAAKGLPDEAIAEFQEAIRLKQNYPNAHYNLGNVQKSKGQLDEAIAAYREAIRLNKDYPEAHCNLGHALRNKGQFAEALTHLRLGHKLGSRNPRWPYPSAQWVKQCERLVELDAKLPRILKGEVQPADVGERLTLAQICQLERKSLYATAARFYAAAFAQQPQLADDLQHEPRYNAACAAALAGCGQGKDSDQTDAKERARLRQQALDWLRADLAAYRRLLDKEPGKVRERMQHWLQDKDFAGLHDPAALAKLSEAERKQWQTLWHDVEDLARQAERGQAPKSSQRP
jgi:tetratricopeptide (TPR) repeat protein